MTEHERGAAPPRRASPASPEHAAGSGGEGRPTGLLERELTLAREHPRGTEQRTLAPYRAALNDVAAYAALPVSDRDAIVRWAAIRCAVRDRFGVDRDRANLAEPLIPAADLRAHVLAGEIRASGREVEDDGGDLLGLVARIRG
ncbi:MAG TPA: hypothetical protein VGT60_10480 [Candidatus Limnocylindria bacterium]|nr:hypothetical protein [Candidatus Limnocylindria bacterium]